jgi:hypothetical protein
MPVYRSFFSAGLNGTNGIRIQNLFIAGDNGRLVTEAQRVITDPSVDSLLFL